MLKMHLLWLLLFCFFSFIIVGSLYEIKIYLLLIFNLLELVVSDAYNENKTLTEIKLL